MADTSKSPRARPRLGRGLTSLISSSVANPVEGQYQSDAAVADADQPAATDQAVINGGGATLPLAEIGPNPYQPRRQFDEADLAELADSIAQQGIIQPLIVVKNINADRDLPYTLVAGERRLRAARLAGLQTAPCIIRQATGQQMLEWALVENIHRSDLNPLERAQAYHQYMDRFSLTHAQAGERLGQPRATISNYVRLLDLPESCQDLLSQGRLTFGHAKILAGLVGQPKLQVRLAKRTADKGLSVRHLEALAVGLAQRAGAAASEKPRPSKPPYIHDLEQRLTQAVGTRVSIRPGRTKSTGRIIIEYYSLDDFDRIAQGLGLGAED